jgi:site-specific recombinase XerC
MSTLKAAVNHNVGQGCVLSNGHRIRFALKRRARDPFYLVYFRGSDGKPKEMSTKEANKRRATDSAIVIIGKDYAPKVPRLSPSWDEAIEMMVSLMKADNLRPGSIKQYEYVVNNLRKLFPHANGPADITPAMAQQFKVLRLKKEITPRSIAGNIDNLNIVYGHWWRDTCKLVTENPFHGVQPPKVDKRPPRIISNDEILQFLEWLSKRLNGWRLPLLFLEVKKITGCRIGELANATSVNLKDGRLYFEEVTTKGRKQRAVKMPPTIYDELQTIAGTAFLFQAFSGQLRAFHQKRGKTSHAQAVKGFTPKRLVQWLQNRVVEYLKAHPEVKKFKLHNFRGTAMSKARMAGISYDDAAIAFGCNPGTMRQHYISLNEVEISDRVMETMQSQT